MRRSSLAGCLAEGGNTIRKITVTALALILVTLIFLQVQAGKKQWLVSTLYSPEQVFSDVLSAKDVAVRFSKDDQVFYVLSIDRQVTVYDSQHRRLRTIPTYMGTPDS